jgi:GT2 family glycosyltransferase
MSQISVIIVSWNAREYLRGCLESIRKTGSSVVHEVIVVDNASTDGSAEMAEKEFAEVILIRSKENLGFARANNLGIKRATGSILALINSDVVVHPNCFQELAAFLEREPKVGLAGPKVFGRDGGLQASCGRLPTVWNITCEFLLLNKLFRGSPLFAGFQMKIDDSNRCTEVEVLSGCFWVARAEAVAKVGGLDEGFFFYAEDIDWCKRFRDGGWKLMFVPQAQATHFGGGSSSNAPLRYCVEILRANLIYWKKHHGNLGRFTYWLLAMIQHSIRLVIRGTARLAGVAKSDETKHKVKEHIVCLRWLLTGKGV